MEDVLTGPSKVTIGSSGGFRIVATRALLRRYRQQGLQVVLGLQVERFERSRERLDRLVPTATARRVGPLICLPFALLSALAARAFGADQDWVGMAIWIGIGMAFLLFALLYANLHWADRWAERRNRRTQWRLAREFRQAFDQPLRHAPYKVRFEFSGGAWIVRSELSGEREVLMSSGMHAYRYENAYILRKARWRHTVSVAASAFAQTSEQQALLEQFLRQHGIPLREIRRKPPLPPIR